MRKRQGGLQPWKLPPDPDQSRHRPASSASIARAISGSRARLTVTLRSSPTPAFEPGNDFGMVCIGRGGVTKFSTTSRVVALSRAPRAT